jgi:hypothetical protein
MVEHQDVENYGLSSEQHFDIKEADDNQFSAL